MIAVYKLIGQVAMTRATVLIRGESGTGKELVARAIHANSARARPSPSCRSTARRCPTTLLESELFGHERGAFTGARQRSARAASSSPTAAPSSSTRSATCRARAAAEAPARRSRRASSSRVGCDAVGARRRPRRSPRRNRDLEAMVEDGTFREDLYYRLDVVAIVLPPLRERRERHPAPRRALPRAHRRATHGRHAPRHCRARRARRACRRTTGRATCASSRTVLPAPSVVASGGVIRPEHLAIAPAREPAAPSLASLNDVEKEHVRRTLDATGGHKARAAEILGVSRPRLNRLLEKYGLE